MVIAAALLLTAAVAPEVPRATALGTASVVIVRAERVSQVAAAGDRQHTVQHHADGIVINFN